MMSASSQAGLNGRRTKKNLPSAGGKLAMPAAVETSQLPK